MLGYFGVGAAWMIRAYWKSKTWITPALIGVAFLAGAVAVGLIK